MQGATANADGTTQFSPRSNGFNPQNMPMHNFGNNFDRGFNRGLGPGGFEMMDHGRGFGFFSPLMSLGHIVFWGLAIWFVYWLFTRSGWKLSLTRQPVEVAKKVEASEPEKKID